jgi:hypothetical protein
VQVLCFRDCRRWNPEISEQPHSSTMHSSDLSSYDKIFLWCESVKSIKIEYPLTVIDRERQLSQFRNTVRKNCLFAKHCPLNHSAMLHNYYQARTGAGEFLLITRLDAADVIQRPNLGRGIQRTCQTNAAASTTRSLMKNVMGEEYNDLVVNKQFFCTGLWAVVHRPPRGGDCVNSPTYTWYPPVCRVRQMLHRRWRDMGK